jgi:hypothetical protein
MTTVERVGAFIEDITRAPSTLRESGPDESQAPAAPERIKLPPPGAEDATASSSNISTAIATSAIDLAGASRIWRWIVLVLLAFVAIAAT